MNLMNDLTLCQKYIFLQLSYAYQMRRVSFGGYEVSVRYLCDSVSLFLIINTDWFNF